MKARKVSITLEVTTALTMKTLKDKMWWYDGMRISEDIYLEVHQIQVNVIKPSK